MADPELNPIFNQTDYTEVVGALDKAMKVLIEKGASETEAQSWMVDFVAHHYCKVWRKIAS